MFTADANVFAQSYENDNDDQGPLHLVGFLPPDNVGVTMAERASI